MTEKIKVDLRNFMDTLELMGKNKEEIEKISAFNVHKVPKKYQGLDYKEIAKTALDKVDEFNKMSLDRKFDIDLIKKGYELLLKSNIIYI